MSRTLLAEIWTLRLIVELLHDLMYRYIYTHMCHANRISIFLVDEVYIRSCRISTMNSRVYFGRTGSRIPSGLPSVLGGRMKQKIS